MIFCTNLLNYATCRDLVIALMMTTSDLCSSCKPWEKHKEGVRALFAEFHDQVRIILLLASHVVHYQNFNDVRISL